MAKFAAPFAALFLLGCCVAVMAQPAPAQSQREVENKQIESAIKPGPADIPLRDDAILHLPKGFAFLPQKEAAILMTRMGNFTNDHFLGLVLPADGKQHWFVDISFDDSGYVKDDEGKSIDADELLQKLKDSTAEENDQRRIKNMAEVEIVGWIEKPHYDPKSHHLIWSLELRDKGSPANGESGVNYNTYTLGRRGYITMDLVTARSLVEANKPMVQQLLSNLEFKQGSRYADFNAKTDKIAEYGLLALIGGVAIKKLGLLALASAFIIKFIKVIIAACVAGWLAIKKFVLGKKDTAAVVTEPAADAPPPSQDMRE